MLVRQLPLYTLVLVLIIFVMITALGGGIFNQQDHWLIQWQHQLFNSLCHQNPERSFWINDQPMAVCSRCLGIYSSFGLGWLLLPVISYVDVFSSSGVKKALVVIIFFNMVDIIGSMLGFWQNTLNSRLVLGGLIGWVTVLLFSGSFFKK